MSMKNLTDAIGNRTGDLLTSNAVFWTICVTACLDVYLAYLNKGHPHVFLKLRGLEL